MKKLSLLTLLFVAGCASFPIPYAGQPEDTIGRARERGAEANPTAQLHLKLAQDNVDKAVMLKNDGKDEAAKLALLMAGADADYALALLRRDTAKAEATEIKNKIEAIKAEMNQ